MLIILGYQIENCVAVYIFLLVSHLQPQFPISSFQPLISNFQSMKRVAAFSVHLFTSSGIVSGFMALVASSEGRLAEAMWWLFLCLIIDGIDGTFARMFRVKEVLPEMDGGTIDYVVDFCTYAVIPAFMMYKAEIFPAEFNIAVIACVLLVSAIYYGKSGMVSGDMHFVGFPVMWNFVAFYLIFVFQFSPWFNVFFTLFFCVLHFVPLKFAYPSRKTPFFIPYILNSVACVGTCVAILWLYPERIEALNYISFATVLVFGGFAVYVTLKE